MMINSPLDHGFSDKDLVNVAKILLNWSAADNFLGNCLNFIYSISNPDDQVDLIFVVDMKKKVDLLWKGRERKQLNPTVIELLSETKKCFELWSEDRNTIAHGMGVRSSNDVMLHTSKKQKLHDPALDIKLNRSSYMVHLTMLMNLRLAGVAPELLWPLPNRPS